MDDEKKKEQNPHSLLNDKISSGEGVKIIYKSAQKEEKMINDHEISAPNIKNKNINQIFIDNSLDNTLNKISDEIAEGNIDELNEDQRNIGEEDLDEKKNFTI